MSIKRNLDETSIVNYICKKAIDNFFMRFERIVSKDKKSQSRLSAKEQFSLSRLSYSPKRRKNAEIFVPDKEW